MIVSQHEWASRSLGSVLSPRGYAVVRAYTAEQALERAEQNNPDAVFIDFTLPEVSAIELARQMSEGSVLSDAAPILLVAAEHVSREQRMKALEAGVWDVVTLPIDADELLLRIDRYVCGKLESDRLREEALIDAVTGLYTWHGINRRLGEVAAAASRYGRPLSCIVVSMAEPSEAGPTGPVPAEVSQVAQQLREAVRTSDLLARIGPSDFAVVAPDTSNEGARILATRLQQMSGEAGSHRRFRAGVYSVDDLQKSALDPTEFLVRATRASHENRVN